MWICSGFGDWTLTSQLVDEGYEIKWDIVCSFLTIRCDWNLPHRAFNWRLFVPILSLIKRPTLLDKHENTGRRSTTRWRQTATDVSWRVSCFALQPELVPMSSVIHHHQCRALYTNSFITKQSTISASVAVKTIYYHVCIRTQTQTFLLFSPLKASLSATHLV